MEKQLLQARAVYGFYPANRVGDDIELYEDEKPRRGDPHVRTTSANNRSNRPGSSTIALADYIAPKGSGRADYLGAFAVTTGHGTDELVARFQAEHDDYNKIMTQALADRLAEAFAEFLHRQARLQWGYGKEEADLSTEDLIREKYRGIRPAPGLSGVPRPHGKARFVPAAGRGKGRRYYPDGVQCDVPGQQRERLVFRAPGGQIFCGGQSWNAIRSPITPSARRCRSHRPNAGSRRTSITTRRGPRRPFDTV